MQSAWFCQSQTGSQKIELRLAHSVLSVKWLRQTELCYSYNEYKNWSKLYRGNIHWMCIIENNNVSNLNM